MYGLALFVLLFLHAQQHRPATTTCYSCFGKLLAVFGNSAWTPLHVLLLLQPVGLAAGGFG
jgi:hypothetical protein